MSTDEMLPQTAQTPLISFVIITYDLPTELLRDCIGSVMALPLSDSEREVVLVDDGSRESPMPGLQPYADHLLYLRKSNGGQSSARNLGIQCSRGTYIQFIDGDDLLNSRVYERCIDIVRREHPDLLLFRHSTTPVSDDASSYEGPVDGSEYLRHHNLRVVPWGYLFRRSMLLNLRFREGIIMEDEEFTPLLFLRADRLFYTDARAYCYRMREGSTTHTTDIEWVMKRLNDTRTVLWSLHERADSMGTADREALQRRVHQLTMDYVYNIMRLTGDRALLEERVAELHDHGLFPLPDRDYTMKYTWFRRLTKTRTGRRFVMRLINR